MEAVTTTLKSTCIDAIISRLDVVDRNAMALLPEEVLLAIWRQIEQRNLASDDWVATLLPALALLDKVSLSHSCVSGQTLRLLKSCSSLTNLDISCCLHIETEDFDELRGSRPWRKLFGS
jgi:hypothetical protein